MMDAAILASLPEEMRERFEDNFAAAVQAQVNANAEAFREDAARREHLHKHQHHRQQQQQQKEQQLRQQQYQQRQNYFRYRQQQQQQYHLQQQSQTSRLWQHQQHYKQETDRHTSEVLRVEARADREETEAERGGAPPTSQTTSKPQSLTEYPVVLFASQQRCSKVLSSQDEQFERMKNGLLRKPVREEIFEKLVQEQEEPQQSLQAAQPRPYLPVEEASEEEMGVLGKDLVDSGGLVVSAGGAGAEEQRPPFWDDTSDNSASWLAPDQTELEIATFCAQRRLPAASREGTFVDDGKVVLGEDGEHAPPLLQQQQELLAAPPQEPWPPPMAAEQEGRGAGSCVESGLWRLDFLSGCGSDDVLSGLHGIRESKESSGKGDASYTTDGCTWERAGIGTGRSCSRTYMGSGCEVAGRRLTRQRRARVREK